MRERRAVALFVLINLLGTAGLASGADGPPSTIESLRSKNVDERRAATIRVVNGKRELQREALPVLIDILMNDKDGQVRLAAFDAVKALGPDASPAIPALLHTLRTDMGGPRLEEAHQDYRSALALAAIGKPAVPGLREILKERKENVRAEAIMALGRIGPDAEAAVPELIDKLGDSSERIRREAAVALGGIGPAAIAPLLAAASSKEVAPRAAAVQGLGFLNAPNESATLAVLNAAGDPEPETRAAALRSLTRMPAADEALEPVLKESLADRDAKPRSAAVALIETRPALRARMVPRLTVLLEAEDDGVARHAAFLLGSAGPSVAPVLLEVLRKPKSRIEPIAEALSRSGRPVADLLTKSVESPDPRVRRGSGLALGMVRPLPAGAVATLTAGLNDRDPEVKAAFLDALGGLGARAAESSPALRGLLRDPAPEIRAKAGEILARANPRDARLIDDLMPMLDDPDAKTQRRAIETIRSLGASSRKALPAVIPKLTSSSRETRLAAAEFVGGQGRAAAEAVPALTGMLDDPTPDLKTVALVTLGKLGPASRPALPKIAALLDSKEPAIREAAALTLGGLELEAEVLRSHLSKALRDESSLVRAAGLRSIQRLGPQGSVFLPDIIALAARKESRMSVERMLRRLERRAPDAKSVPELVGLLKHERDEVRLLAIKFLGLAGPNASEAIPVLEKLRDDPNPEIRQQSEAARKRIAEKPRGTA